MRRGEALPPVRLRAYGTASSRACSCTSGRPPPVVHRSRRDAHEPRSAPYRFVMSTTSNRMLIACLGAFLVSGILVACGVFAALGRAASGDPDPRGSDREAERAAMAVVRPYFRVIDEIAADGGAESQRVGRFVTNDHGSQLAVAFAGMRARGWKASGSTVIVGDEMIGRRTRHDGAAGVGIRLCLDVSNTRVVGHFGGRQPPADRVGRVPYDVWLTTSGVTGRQLRIESTRMREELAPC